MANYNDNSTNYFHSYEPNTNDLTMAMDYDPYGKPVIRIDDTTTQHTSKNRVKTSDYEIIDYANFQYTEQTDIWDEHITGTAASTHDLYHGMVELSIGANVGDQIIRQTKRVVRYTPGRQNEVSMSLIFGTPTLGIRRRFGLFDEAVGMFFEDAGDGNYYVVIRNTTSSGLIETRISRDNWNVDKFDGTGPSGITADPEAIQHMVIEYEWFGAGQVEFKFIINNNAYPVHQFNHANVLHDTFMSTPFVPVRVELTNLTGVAGTHTFHQGSHSVQAEGQLSIVGRSQNIASPVTGYTLTVANTFYPVLSLRLKSNRLRGVIIPNKFTGATLDNTSIFVQVRRNATLTGGTWVNYADYSHAEYNLTATAITGGDILFTSFINAGGQGLQYDFADEVISQLGRYTTSTLGDTSDTISVAIACVNANKAGWASLSWVEVR